MFRMAICLGKVTFVDTSCPLHDLGAMWLIDCWPDSGKNHGSIDKLRLPFTWLQPAATSGASAAGADAASAATSAAGAAKATKTVFSLSLSVGTIQ